MAAWVVWLLVAVLLGVVEGFTLTAALGLLGGAAALTAGAAALGLGVPLQLLVFALAAATGLVLLRPIAARQRRPRPERFGVDALAGATGYVLREVSERPGLVRIGGEQWTARALIEGTVIPTGTTVQVLRVDGATAIVYPRELE